MPCFFCLIYKKKKSDFLPLKYIQSLSLVSEFAAGGWSDILIIGKLPYKFLLFRWYVKTRFQRIEISLFESHGQPSKVSLCSVPQEHFRTNPEVSLSSTFSDSLISLFPSPLRWALWCSVSFPLAFTPLPVSVLLVFFKRNAKVPHSGTFLKGWTLTFCKVFYLLLDPLVGGCAALWLGCACVVSSHQARPSDRRPNRCQGAGKGVDWSLERPRSSNGTPERTPESHTLSSRPRLPLLCFTQMTPFNGSLSLWRISYTAEVLPVSCRFLRTPLRKCLNSLTEVVVATAGGVPSPLTLPAR